MASAHETETPDFSEIPDPLESSGGDLTHGVNESSLRSRSARPGPTRDDLARRRRTLLLASGVWLLALLAGFGVRRDFGTLPPSQLLWMEVVPLVGVFVCARFALASGALGLGTRSNALLFAGVAALLVPATLSFVLLPAGSAGLGARQHLACFAIAFGGAFPPLLLLGLSLPHSFVARPRLRAMLLGLAAGLGGVSLVNLHCAANSRVHVSFAHHAPLLALAVFAALWLGHRMRV